MQTAAYNFAQRSLEILAIGDLPQELASTLEPAGFSHAELQKLVRHTS